MIISLLKFLNRTFGLSSEFQDQASPGAARTGLQTPDGPSVGQKLDGDTRVLQPAYTIRLKPNPVDEELQSSRDIVESTTKRSASETVLVWCGLTDTGMVRDHNEDSFSCKAFGESILFVLADGMGGHDAGEVASRLAVEAVCREVDGGLKRRYDPLKLIEKAVQKANSEVVREGTSRGSNMGTTLNAALVDHDAVYIANVGDSRAYWIENGNIRQITEDHSLVAKLVSAGKLTQEEARNHPKSNLLYRTIGSDQDVKVDTFRTGLKHNSCLLLCTDGLWGEVPDQEIYNVCSSEKNVKSACVRLIRLAKENGGRDNITAIVVKVE